MKRIFLATLAGFCLLFTSQAFAQEDAANNDGYDARAALAERIHELRPVREQVDSAIAQFSQRFPENERAGIKSAMSNAFNIKALENISINAYAETFTEEELKVLIEYYTNPVAVSTTEKMEIYSGIVYPELVKMLDRAAMKARTGQ